MSAYARHAAVITDCASLGGKVHPLNSQCPIPHHTTQTVAPSHKVHAASITLTRDILKEVRVSLCTTSASEDSHLRIKNRLITAQP